MRFNMVHLFSLISLMLISIGFSTSASVLELHKANSHNAAHPHLQRPVGHWRLAGRDLPSKSTLNIISTSTATPCNGGHCIGAYPSSSNLPCANINGTEIVAGVGRTKWTMLCDVDFFAQDIFPFLVAQTFEECLQFCEDYNTKNRNASCAGFVFAPDRIWYDNDCYLKSSVNDVVYPATIHLIGATLAAQSSSPTSIITSTPTSYALPTAILGDSGADLQSKAQGPSIIETKSLGASVNNPSTQYVVHQPTFPRKLAKSLVKPGINLDLITKYPLASDTGSWTSTSFKVDPEFANMSVVPRMSRDGGRGGNINGTHIFMFCDTATFGNEDTAYMGYMNGFVSSSAAVMDDVDVLNLDHLVLKDTVGQWQDDVGRLRGWIEQTTGEQAFNVEISGDGFRYAIWPESSFIPLNGTSALIFAPVVYVEVNMSTQQSSFTSLGNSLVLISADPLGPHADRLVSLLFQEPEVEWGTIGGLRAWGATGNTTFDGMLYLFGQVEQGILVAKVSPQSIQDRSAYQYWNGDDWTGVIPDRNSTAFFIEQPVMSFDMFYSPFHQYFIMVYMTPNADNTFWYRYLQVPVDHKIIPPYMPGGDENYCERILHDQWSEPQILWKIDPPQIGYAYAGGAHMGFFGANDIIYGGNYLLITWTEHTEKDPNDPASGYAHKAARIQLT